ncbi:helix-turn-helix domain-containing protein [Ascidiaceihabitans sp.]|uniref:helix-turn-helix domain-containing protein n=1 Tax=Ascidiaceihabitans sp. TaxID=1872644 RepID=UPI003298C28D
MPRGRILTQSERLVIVRAAAKGVGKQQIAQRFGVTRRTIDYTIKREKDRRRDTGIRTAAASVTVTPDELKAFDAVLAKRGFDSRADGLRALMQASNGIFVPDEHLSGELSSFRAALNRVGNNVTQIARRMNEAKKRGMPAPWSERQYEEIRSLAGMILEMGDQIDLLVRRRNAAMGVTVDEVLREFALGTE